MPDYPYGLQPPGFPVRQEVSRPMYSAEVILTEYGDGDAHPNQAGTVTQARGRGERVKYAC